MVALFALVSLGPLVALGVGTNTLATRAVRQQVDSNLDTTAQVGALFVQQQMESLAELVEAYAQRRLLARAFGDGDPEATDREAVADHLEQLQAARPGIAIAFAARLDGVL